MGFDLESAVKERLQNIANRGKIRNMIPARSIAGAVVFCWGASLAVAGPYVKISQSRGADGSGTSCSSGTLIGWTTDLKEGIFVSCAHGYHSQRELQVEVDKSEGQSGRIIAINRDYDLSLVAAPCNRAEPIIKLAMRDPSKIDAVSLAGFPAGEFQCTQATVRHRIWSRNMGTKHWKLYTPTARSAVPAGYQELWITDQPAPQGLSGGAMIYDGRLAGVIVGRVTNSADAGLVVPAETVSRFVGRNISLFYQDKPGSRTNNDRGDHRAVCR